ncbi:MAG: glycoside hydrolase family 1 protein [Erysipelotrichaceae bacterium]|jgi:6-phospho-beta-glucosidase|nr:glycoside hydrolase family 1 protein [Erysipelotrichaceae bacterium]
MTKPLPKTFYWGSSTNAQQFEGGWNLDHKGETIADARVLQGGFSNFKVASDHYHRMDEDFDLYQEMGFTIYRFSISWARIFPSGDDETPNPEGLKFYDYMVDGLIKRGIAPVATLYAYDLPLALLKKYGGFKDRRCIDAYENYVRTVFKHFKGRIKFYTPFNEPNLFHMDQEYIAGNAGLKQSDKETWQIEHHLTLAYAKCVNACHEIDPDAKIGPNTACGVVYPATCNPKDARLAQREMYLRNWAYLDTYCRGGYPQYFLNYLEEMDVLPEMLAGDKELIASVKPDIISTTYYSSSVASSDPDHFKSKPLPAAKEFQEARVQYRPSILNPYTSETEWGWIIDPDGFYYQLTELYHRYQLPIVILENGIAATEEIDENGKVYDDYRIDYLAKHIECMKEAVADGVDLLAYLTWSATDLHSTREGFVKRYGFVYVDRYEHSLRTLDRYKKKSFWWYKKVIASNGEDLKNDIEY